MVSKPISKTSLFGLLALSLLPVMSSYVLTATVEVEPFLVVALAFFESVCISLFLFYLGYKNNVRGIVIWAILFVLLMPVANFFFTIYFYFASDGREAR